MSKVSPETESLRKTGSKTVFLKILVSLKMIKTPTDIPDKGWIYIKDDRPVVVFSM